jgi:hypothetical protein
LQEACKDIRRIMPGNHRTIQSLEVLVMSLQPLSEKQKLYLRRLKGIKKPFSLDRPAHPFKAVREFLAPVREDYIPAKPRGSSGVRMSHSKRLMVLSRQDARKAFFAEIENAL